MLLFLLIILIMNELYPCVILLIISILFLRSMEKVVPWVST